MKAKFYKIACPKNVVDKSSHLGSVHEIDIAPYNAIDDLHGYVMIDRSYSWKNSPDSPTQTEYHEGTNYVEIKFPEGQNGYKTRYFFVTSREPDIGSKLRLNLEEDVLMTWKNEILNTECLIEQATALGNSYVPSQYPVKSFTRVFEDCSPELYYDYNGTTYFGMLYCGTNWADAGETMLNTGGGAGQSIKQQMTQSN